MIRTPPVRQARILDEVIFKDQPVTAPTLPYKPALCAEITIFLKIRKNNGKIYRSQDQNRT